MKIYEAAKIVLKEAGEPMHARDIHREIVARGLYTFRAKNPASIVSQALRNKSRDAPGDEADVIFKRTSPGTYGLVNWDS